MTVLKSLTTTMLFLLLLINNYLIVTGLRCGDCAADCGSPGVCETKGKCFLRRDVNGLIYRGCADGKRWNGLLYTYNGCQFQNYLGWNGEKVYWCFCDEENCNDLDMEVLQDKYGVYPLSVAQYSDKGPLGGLLGPAKPTNAGPMSDYTQDRSPEVQGQGRRQFEGQADSYARQGQPVRDLPGQGLQGFERKAPVPELTGIPRFQTAGEKSPEERYSTADPRFTSNSKFNAFSPTEPAPIDNYLPRKQGAPGYFRYVPSDPDYVQVAPGQGPMTREALLEVLRQNGYDITQHSNDTSDGVSGVVLTYKSPDGSSISAPGPVNEEATDPRVLGLEPDSPRSAATLSPSEVLSFINNLRADGQGDTPTSRESNDVTDDAIADVRAVARESTTESTATISLRHIVTTSSAVTTPSPPSQEDYNRIASSVKPQLFDDIVRPTPSVNFQDLLKSMKKADDDAKENNETSSLNADVKNDAKTNVTSPEDSQSLVASSSMDIPNHIIECPPSWIYDQTQNSCYKIERQRKTFHEAAHNCSQYDQRAHLVSIETDEEYKFVVYQLKEQEKHLNGWQGWWTSGVYDPSIREFIWLNTGFVISRLNSMWHPSLLVTPFQQTCVWLVPNAGHPLGNYGCSQSSGFICELELT